MAILIPQETFGLIYLLIVFAKLSLTPDSSPSSKLTFLELEFIFNAPALSSGWAEEPGSPEPLPKQGL